MSKRNEPDKFKMELCMILTRIGALNFGVFNLSNGTLSPYYIDLRLIPSFPEALRKVEELYRQVALKELDLHEIKRVAGIPTAGIPFASLLAFSLNKPFLYVRGEASRGRQRRVEGILNPGDPVLLVDDLISTGKTMQSAVDVIRSEGGVVKDALVLIDRQEGGDLVLASQGIRLNCVLRMSEAAKILYDTGTIDKEQLRAIMRQIT